MRWSVFLLTGLAAASLSFAGPLNVAAGFDSFHTQSTSKPVTSPPIPADCFGPGSDPFTGVISFVGIPALPAAPLSDLQLLFGGMGGATWFGPSTLVSPVNPGPDTIIERKADALLPDGGSDTVPIELVQLNLTSVNPITVTYNGGQNPSQWDVQVVLTPPPAAGSMTLNRNGSSNSGTFTTTMQISAHFVFTRVGVTSPPVLFSVTDSLSGAGTFEARSQAEVPEPGTWLLAGGGFALLIVRRRLADIQIRRRRNLAPVSRLHLRQ